MMFQKTTVVDRDIFDRTWSMVQEWRRSHPEERPKDYRWVAAPFGFTEPPPLRWRVSCDVYERLTVDFDGALAWVDASMGDGTDRLYSIPLIHECEALPSNSVILEGA